MNLESKAIRIRILGYPPVPNSYPNSEELHSPQTSTNACRSTSTRPGSRHYYLGSQDCGVESYRVEMRYQSRLATTP
jgi:hypothetical protein